jgi:hypothetical protein
MSAEPLVGGEGGRVDRGELVTRRLRDLVGDRLEGVRARLSDLRAHVLGRGDVELVRRDRVTHAELVEGADTVPEPLARHEDRGADVEAKRVVLERRPMPFAHEEADEPGVGLLHRLLAAREADPRGIDHREIARHRVVEADEPVIKDLDRFFGHRVLHRAHVERV